MFCSNCFCLCVYSSNSYQCPDTDDDCQDNAYQSNSSSCHVYLQNCRITSNYTYWAVRFHLCLRHVSGDGDVELDGFGQRIVDRAAPQGIRQQFLGSLLGQRCRPHVDVTRCSVDAGNIVVTVTSQRHGQLLYRVSRQLHYCSQVQVQASTQRRYEDLHWPQALLFDAMARIEDQLHATRARDSENLLYPLELQLDVHERPPGTQAFLNQSYYDLASPATAGSPRRDLRGARDFSGQAPVDPVVQ